jgi:ubiquinone/menaquinone biosynthesis C-methylase UbiE
LADSDTLFAGSRPELYDTYLVPLIFEGFADDLAERTAALAPKAVLETAAGTGVVTRALAPRLASGSRYAVTDLNQPMVDHAASKQGPDGRITWRQADALELPFDAASFDAVVCQFAVMFFPDRVEGFAEALQVLKPGGSFLFNVWDRIETNGFADTVTEAVAGAFPEDPSRFLARTPHGYHDAALIREELGRAGFTNVSIATLEQTSRAASARDVAIAYCQRTPLRNEIEARGAELLRRITDVAAAVEARFGDGPVSGKIQALVVTAVR